MGLQSFTQRLGRRMAGIGDDLPLGIGENDHLYRIALENFLNASESIVTVTRSSAMTIGTVANSRHRLAGTVGRLPMTAKRGGTRVPQTDQPALLGQPEGDHVPRATTLTWTVDALFFHPCTWWLVRDRDFYGWPRRGEWIDRKRATLDNHGRLVRVDNEPVRPEDVIRFDSPLGEGYLKHARRDIQRAIAINIAASKAEDSPIPAVELHNEENVSLKPEERAALIEAWAEARRASGVAYTPKGIKVIPHGQPLERLLIDARKAIALELIRHAALPAWAGNVAIEGGTMTYDNRALHNFELIDLGAAAYMTAIDGRLSLPDVTPRGWEVEMLADQLTREPMQTRFQSYEIGIRAGFIDNAWIAEQEGWASAPADKKPEEAAA